MKRDLLINCLNGVLEKQFDSLVMRQPGTTFQEVWQHLEKRYQVDDPHRWRREWAAVSLDTKGDRILLKDLHFFESAFETAKSQVADWTSQEENDLILKQLPLKWRNKVLHKEATSSKNKFVVKMSNLPQPCDVKQVLQQLGLQVEQVVQLAGCSHVTLTTALDQEKLIQMNLKLNGQKITCIPIRHRWGSQDIFRYLSDEIRIEQESWVLSRGVENTNPGRTPNPLNLTKNSRLEEV